MRKLTRFGLILTLGGCLLSVAPVLATDASADLSVIISAEELSPLNNQSLMSQVTDGLFLGAYDYAHRADTVGQTTRDEATRYLSRPSMGSDKAACMMFGNLSSQNSTDSFSAGGVTSIGPGRFAGFAGYQNWKDWGMFDSNSSDEDMRVWNLTALYAWNVGPGWLGFHVSHNKGNSSGSNENFSSRSSGSFDSKYTMLDVAYSQPVNDNGGWAVGVWLSQTDVFADQRSRVSGNFSEVEQYDSSGNTFGVYGRYNMSFGHADGQVDLSIRRGTYDLNNPTTFFERIVSKGTFNIRDRVSGDDAKRTTYSAGWTYLDRMGEKVDFAYGVRYNYSKDEASLTGHEFFAGSNIGRFRSSADGKSRVLSIPMAARLQITPSLRGFVGAGFNYRWDEGGTSSSFTDEGTDRSSGKSDHTNTSYAAGLRYELDNRLSAEVGWLSSTGDSSNSDRDTVRADRINFQITLSW